MITRERLKEVLNYDAESGIFAWRAQLSSRVKIGERAGCIDRIGKRVVIRVDGNLYFAHRLAWLYECGQMPIEIDHVDGDSLNNRFSNLRLATRGENTRNIRGHRDGSLGVKGVTKNGSGFQARITVDGNLHRLGTFRTIDEAKAAWDKAALELHGEFARL